MARCSCAVVAGTLMLGVATWASAQPSPSPAPAASPLPPGSGDTRTQYPAFLTNSYFSFNVGYIRSDLSTQQLEPGFGAEAMEFPHLGVRVGLFGHEFSRWLSAQATYMRPARFVVYRNVNGDERHHQVREGFGGVTLVARRPLRGRASLYGEGGLGLTSRSGFAIDGTTVIGDVHFASALLGAGVEYRATPTVDFVLGATYSPGRRSFSQPPTRLFTTGIRYTMRQLPAAQVEDNQKAGFIFPENVVRVGYSTNTFAYGVNHFFSRTIPVFWEGNVETRRGVTLDYQRNIFHTRKLFAFDLGACAAYWQSNGNAEVFRTLSAYPLLRFTLLRTRRSDWYVNYSLAGPSYVSRAVIDNRDTGARFTFQDFMGVGGFVGKHRRTNVEIGIKHYSNGNMLPRNAAIKIPLTVSVGHTF